MRTPSRPVPESIARWVARARWLRSLDALAAWSALWVLLLTALGPARATPAGVLAALVTAGGCAIAGVRVRWRPVSALIALTVSRSLRPGDRAWYIGTHEATLILVTARHGIRLVIARPDLSEQEGIGVRRTRVLLLPAEP